jgi:hypothetical protein
MRKLLAAQRPILAELVRRVSGKGSDPAGLTGQ